MPYVRKKGNQIAIVHGERAPETGGVNQKTLFTFFSKAEAYRATGKGKKDESHYFQHLLEDEHPAINFNWPKINQAILDKVDDLPDLAEYQEQRLAANFKSSLYAFAKEIVQTDPQSFAPSSKLLLEHKSQLEFLRDIIDMKLATIDPCENEFNGDNEFYWRQTLRGWGINPDVEKLASDLYRSRDFEGAISAFTLLTESFPNYAEGHNYLGLIHLDQGDLEAAISHFRKTVELGRRMFPKRIKKEHYWADHKTRPYIRGLNNLVTALCRNQEFDEALACCDKIANECGDDFSATSHRALIFINTGNWREAEECSVKSMNSAPMDAAIAAFAQFELGEISKARESFLFAAFNNPFGTQILLQNRVRKKPKGMIEVEDYNAGVDLANGISPYLSRRGTKARSFFRSILKHPDIKALIDEVSTCASNHSSLDDREERRQNFDRWHEIKELSFAKKIANTVLLEHQFG